MSGNLRLNGKTSGYSQLAAPDAAGDQTFTFPTTGGTLAIASSNSGGQPVPGYQQGTWTPALKFGSNDAGLTYASRGGWYTRVGNLVTLCGFIILSAKGTSTGTVTIEDVPYNGNALFSPNTALTGGGTVTYYDNVSGTGVRPALAFNSSSNVVQMHNSGGGNTGDSNFASNSSVRFILHYVTDNTDWNPINGATVDS